MKGMKKYVIYMGVAVIVLALGLCAASGIQAYAAPKAVNSDVDAFKELPGEQAYIQEKYFFNYSFYMEETKMSDMGYALMNDFANSAFDTMKWLARLTVTVFYYSMDFDLTKLLKDQISAIQSSLNSGIFQPLFSIGFAATAIILLKKYIRRDVAGALGQIARVVFLVVLSVLIVRESETVLSTATKLTKSISAQAIGGINGKNQDISRYAASCSGVLWVNLIHQPWLTMQFGEDEVKDEYVITLLGANKEQRGKFIEEYQGTAFSKEKAASRLGFMILYSVPFIIKCVIYIGVSLIQLVFQFIALFYVLLAPVILILSMFPGYEGLLGAWVRKILESQLSILIVTFFTGLLVKVDEILYSFANEWGWLSVMLVQVIIAVGAFWKREQILGTFNKLQHAATSPSQTISMMNNGVNGYGTVINGMKSGARLTGNGARAYGRHLKDKVVEVTQGVKEMGNDMRSGMKNVGRTITEGAKAKKNADIMQAAGSYQVDYSVKGKKEKVIRQNTGEALPGEGLAQVKENPETDENQNVEIQRPRLDNIVQFKEVQEAVKQVQESEQKPPEAQIEAKRPRMEDFAKTDEKPQNEPHRTSERVQKKKKEPAGRLRRSSERSYRV